MVKMPLSGKSTMGSMAVTGMGAASVTHQVIIQVAMPITFQASGVRTEAGASSCTRKNRVGPNTRPIILASEN